MSKKKIALSAKKHKEYQEQAEMINFLRANPVIACRELLGIQLIDSQAWVLQNSWNTPKNLWTCSRGFGKSFMLAIIAMLKLLLYPNIRIYILSSKGSQAIETFMKLEDIAKQRIDTIDSLKDIFINEVATSRGSDGFSHDKVSHQVSTYSGGTVYTLNSKPDNIRGKRAEIVMFDESAFCTDELIEVALPFIAVDSSFKTSTEEGFDTRTLKKRVPNQVFFASSAGDITSRHAKEYKEYAKRMIIGDKNYFCADIPCDIPLSPMIMGKTVEPLLSQEEIDKEMRLNPDKAMREYYNQFVTDGGGSQIIKWADIRRNETFELPELENDDSGAQYLIAFDPAHGSDDNSILGVMKVTYDENDGYTGKIVNVFNLIDMNKSEKRNLKFTDQKKVLRQLLLDYSGGDKMYYKDIHRVYMDAGAGGHGTSYADELLEDWVDRDGVTHGGLIDTTHPKYKGDDKIFTKAKDILRLMNPGSMKNQMIANAQAMFKSDLIHLPKEYDGKGQITREVEVKRGDTIEIELEYEQIDKEQNISLVNIDFMKNEMTSIEQTTNGYRTMPSRSHVGDDRFDVFVMLGHGLYEMRAKDRKQSQRKERSYADYFIATKAGR